MQFCGPGPLQVMQVESHSLQSISEVSGYWCEEIQEFPQELFSKRKNRLFKHERQFVALISHVLQLLLTASQESQVLLTSFLKVELSRQDVKHCPLLFKNNVEFAHFVQLNSPAPTQFRQVSWHNLQTLSFSSPYSFSNKQVLLQELFCVTRKSGVLQEEQFSA